MLIRTFLTVYVAAFAIEAGATNKPPSTPPSAPTSAEAQAAADAKAAADSKAFGYSKSVSMQSMDGSTRSFTLFGGGTATPLPPTNCPKGDSFYLQVLGGLAFTYATSSTRTEMECLDKVLAIMRAAPPPPPEPRLSLDGPLHPPKCETPKKKVAGTGLKAPPNRKICT